MKIVTGLLILTALLFNSSRGKNCRCTPATSNETTRAGGNEWIAYKAGGVYRKIQGMVHMPLPELDEDVLVEVFDHPDYLLCEWRPNNPNKCSIVPTEKQRRIAACKTGTDGRFRFENIPAGKYELRVSKDQGWSPTHVYVVLDPRNAKSIKKPVEVTLKIGT